MRKFYHVVVINDKTGYKVKMTEKPVTFEEGSVILSKIRDYPGRTKQLEQVL